MSKRRAPPTYVLLGGALALLAGCPTPTTKVDCEKNADCPASQGCVEAKCATCPTCAESERCVAGACLSTTCGPVECAPGTGCSDGVCVDSTCAGVSCPTDQACAKGACHPKSCGGTSCPPGQVCSGGACISAACVGVACAAGTVCAAGLCVPQSCAGATCPAGSGCVDGACVNLACAGVSCVKGFACLLGLCLPTDCAEVPCPAGHVCENQTCVDAACAGAACPSGTGCSGGLCVSCVSDAGAVDTQNDVANCGACGKRCPTPVASTAVCVQGKCARSPCAVGRFDFDGAATFGCEASCTGRVCTLPNGDVVTLTATPLPETGERNSAFASGSSLGAGIQTNPQFTNQGLLGEATPPLADGGVRQQNGQFLHQGGFSTEHTR